MRARCVPREGLRLGTSLGQMSYTSAEARQELLDGFAVAIERIGLALAALGAAYEQLDEYNADRLEAQLFGPVQLAYGRAKSTHAPVRRPPRHHEPRVRDTVAGHSLDRREGVYRQRGQRRGRS